MSAETWKHVYDLREGDIIRVGPNGQLFTRVNNPHNPHEEVCRVVEKTPLTKDQRTIIEWLARISKSFLACASSEERKEIRDAISVAEAMLRE